MAEQQPIHFSPEHVQQLQWQAKLHTLQPNPADLPISNTPLVDAFIERAAKDMARSEWKGMETEPSEKDIQRAERIIEEGKGLSR